jgi:NAD(P)-dependent dehydrogenase (short-subunit alcohol dehydrogenase family)
VAGRPVTLAGATAVVTGTSRGIGWAIAEALTAAGARVVGLSRGGSTPPGVDHVTADLLDPASLDHAVEQSKRTLGGPPDILVNNAGAFVVAPIEETTADTFDRVLALNLSAPFRLVRAFVAGMRARGSGHIVSIGSVADHVAFPGNAAYAASKFGLRGLHEVMRAELAGTGVRATLIAPGAVDTPLWDALVPATRSTMPSADQMLSASDVADAVLYAVMRPPAVSVDEVRLSRG